LLEGGADAMRKLGDASEARLAITQRVTQEQRFFHWQLTFAEVFAQRGGMDVFLGNPPWVKVEWKEAGVLGDIDPLLNLRKLSAKKVADRRREVLAESEAATAEYLAELAGTQGQGAYIASGANYPLLRGVQGNLYKCFIERSGPLVSKSGSTGLLHPEGPYDDPKAGALRRSIYTRLRLHAQFANEKDLFTEIHNRIRYSINVYGSVREPTFLSMCGLFVPQTVLD